ncbi:ANTAR domain-containing protein [Streptomyces sp. NPDC059009]|uniref:ANTAR domain-containing protein n=1 Tax=Streptomyces sp. NPDC059009 TaxID=3346694 RepID=UPI00367F63B6
MAREHRLAEAFVVAADSSGDDFDVHEFLRGVSARCVELLGVTAAGFLLVDDGGDPHTVVASDERAGQLGHFTVERGEGPLLDCCRSGTARVNMDLTRSETAEKWPDFVLRARVAGFTTAQALPLRQRGRPVGALGLFQEGGPLHRDEIALAQGLADVATIAILQRRSLDRGSVERNQLQAALTSRIVIEQAKGMLAERWGCTVDEAFMALRAHARSHRLRLAELAARVVAGQTDTAQISR